MKILKIFFSLFILPFIFTSSILLASEPQNELTQKIETLNQIIQQEKSEIQSVKETLLKLKEEKDLSREKLSEANKKIEELTKLIQEKEQEKEKAKPDYKLQHNLTEANKKIEELTKIIQEKEKEKAKPQDKPQAPDEKEIKKFFLEVKENAWGKEKKVLESNLQAYKREQKALAQYLKKATEKSDARKEKEKKIPFKLSPKCRSEAQPLLKKIDDKNREITHLKDIINRAIKHLGLPRRNDK